MSKLTYLLVFSYCKSNVKVCHLLQQKIIDKENTLAADKAYMESVEKQEFLKASHDDELVRQAK